MAKTIVGSDPWVAIINRVNVLGSASPERAVYGRSAWAQEFSTCDLVGGVQPVYHDWLQFNKTLALGGSVFDIRESFAPSGRPSTPFNWHDLPVLVSEHEGGNTSADYRIKFDSEAEFILPKVKSWFEIDGYDLACSIGLSGWTAHYSCAGKSDELVVPFPDLSPVTDELGPVVESINEEAEKIVIDFEDEWRIGYCYQDDECFWVLWEDWKHIDSGDCRTWHPMFEEPCDPEQDPLIQPPPDGWIKIEEGVPLEPLCGFPIDATVEIYIWDPFSAQYRPMGTGGPWGDCLNLGGS